MTRPRGTRSAALALALAALAAPAAAAQQHDLRSPDNRDAALSAQPPQALRSPDTRDAAAGLTTVTTPAVPVVKAPPSAPSADGIDWTDAGIGAASLLGLIALGLAGTFSVLYRRRGGPTRRQTATASQEGP